MSGKNIEKKVVITNASDLLKVPLNSWVEINGKAEFRILCHSVKTAITLSVEENYVCKNHYDSFLASLTPIYIQKFLKETEEGRSYLKMIEMENDK